MNLESLKQRKIRLIIELFINPADEDYVTARWCFNNGNFNHFYWSASQALEKLFKACLLIKDASAKSAGHSLTKLLTKLDTLPDTSAYLNKKCLASPFPISQDLFWQSKLVPDLLQHFEYYGSPDSRYGGTGIWVRPGLLFAFDELVCGLRSMISADTTLDSDLYNCIRKMYYGETSSKVSKWMIAPTLKLERLHSRRWLDAGETDGLISAFKSVNYFFFSNGLEMGDSYWGTAIQYSPINNQLVRLDKVSNFDDYSTELLKKQHESDTVRLRQWVDDRIHLSPAAKSELTRLQSLPVIRSS